MDYDQYRQETNGTLLEFLKVELGLIETFIQKATITDWPESRKDALSSARAGLRTVRKFEGRIIAAADRDWIHSRVDELEQIISSL